MAYMIANAIALFLLFASGKWPRLGRSLFVLLFAGASYTNWWVLATSPKDYLGYADLTFCCCTKISSMAGSAHTLNWWWASLPPFRR